MTSQSHRIRGGAADEAFQEQCLCGRKELLLVGSVFDLFNVEDHLHQKNIYKTAKRDRFPFRRRL